MFIKAPTIPKKNAGDGQLCRDKIKCEPMNLTSSLKRISPTENILWSIQNSNWNPETVINHSQRILPLLLFKSDFPLCFCLSQLFDLYMTCRYRNQGDPRANPGTFL